MENDKIITAEGIDISHAVSSHNNAFYNQLLDHCVANAASLSGSSLKYQEIRQKPKEEQLKFVQDNFDDNWKHYLTSVITSHQQELDIVLGAVREKGILAIFENGLTENGELDKIDENCCKHAVEKGIMSQCGTKDRYYYTSDNSEYYGTTYQLSGFSSILTDILERQYDDCKELNPNLPHLDFYTGITKEDVLHLVEGIKTGKIKTEKAEPTQPTSKDNLVSAVALKNLVQLQR